MTLAPIEQFIVEQALYSELGEHLKTGRDNNLRGVVTENYRQIYELTGATSFDLKLAGKKVGSFSFAKTKAQAAHDESFLRMEDVEKFEQWLVDQGAEFLLELIPQETYRDIAERIVNDTGELPDGWKICTTHVPPLEAGITGNGTARIDRELVQEAVQVGKLTEAVKGLLGGVE